MEIAYDQIHALDIEHQSDIGISRRKAVVLASQLGFDKVKTGEIAILVTELVSNVIKHGGGTGRIVICRHLLTNRKPAIEIWCLDRGPGIQKPNDAFSDGFSSKKSLGIGLGTIRRFSDELSFGIEKLPEALKGNACSTQPFTNCIRVLKWVPEPPWIGLNKSLKVGASSRSKPGEHINGDAFLIHHIAPAITIAGVIDGLGHGKEAHIATQQTIEQIITKLELPLAELINYLHSAIKGTRGVVLGLMLIDTNRNTLSFTGTGNIEGFLISSTDKKNLLSFGGIVGHNIRTPRVYDFPFNPGDTVCLYSDGITSRWNCQELENETDLQKAAETVIDKYARKNDDATILILRYST